MLDRWRLAGAAPRLGAVRLPAFVAGRWSAAAARAARFASRDWFGVIGRVNARDRLDDDRTVLERLEISIAAVPQADRREERIQMFRLVRDRAVDFLVDETGVETASCEPVLVCDGGEPALAGAEAQQLLERATWLIPELIDLVVFTVRTRRATLRDGDVVEVRGEPTRWIDPSVDRSYRDLPVRAAIRGSPGAPALVMTP